MGLTGGGSAGRGGEGGSPGCGVPRLGVGGFGIDGFISFLSDIIYFLILIETGWLVLGGRKSTVTEKRLAEPFRHGLLLLADATDQRLNLIDDHSDLRSVKFFALAFGL